MGKEMKKSRSDADALPRPVSDTRTSRRDVRNFHIKKKTRFAVRGFELAIAAIWLSLLFKQDRGMLEANELYAGVMFAKALGFGTGFACILGILLYATPVFLKWSSRKLVTIETTMDVVVLGGLVMCFISLLGVSKAGTAGAACPIGKSAACDTFNWSLFFHALQSAVWLVSLGVDINGIRLGIWPDNARSLENELDALRRRESLKG